MHLGKKTFLIFLFLTFSMVSFAQNFSYGASVSRVRYESNNAGLDFINKNDVWATALGAYAEYNFNPNFGLKTELIYLKQELGTIIGFSNEYTFYDFNVVQLAPSFKVDFGNEYRHGFYMMVGPKVSFVTKVSPDDMDFEKLIFGSQFALGYRVFKVIDVQAKLDFDLMPFLEVNDKVSSFFAGGFSVGVDLERIINKK